MRELHVEAPAGRCDDVESALREHDVEFVTASREDGSTLFFFALPTAAVAPILEALREAGIDEESYTVVTKAEAVETAGYDELRERYANAVGKLSKEELHAKISELQWPFQIYYLGTVLSVLAAAAGLLLDQPALIIGAMIIAPQASSALAAPAGALLSDWGLFVGSLKEQVLGLGVAVVGAAMFGWFVRWTGFVPPLLSLLQVELVGVRLAPSFLSTVGAVIAGVVGAFGYTTEQSTALIGVMIAAALIPSAATAGLAVAWGLPLLVVGALLLLLVNLVAINGGAFLTLLAMGYDPDWREGDSSFRDSISDSRKTAVYVTLAVLFVTVVATGYLTGANVLFTQSVNQEVQATLDDPGYANLSLSTVQVEYRGPVVGETPSTVTVGVSRPSNREYPDLAGRLERQIEGATGRNVETTVAFTESRTSNATAP
jgi:uncharacterized hydrophobic protein (TIGR00271 family)